MEQHADDVSQLTNQKADLLSHDICAKHSAAHDLNEQVYTQYIIMDCYFNPLFTDIGAGGYVVGAGAVIASYT